MRIRRRRFAVSLIAAALVFGGALFVGHRAGATSFRTTSAAGQVHLTSSQDATSQGEENRGETPDATETPEATETPQASETPDASETPEAAETPDAESNDAEDHGDSDRGSSHSEGDHGSDDHGGDGSEH